MTDRTADRLDIGELLARYSWAMTDRQWDTWQALFTTDASADYSGAGGTNAGPAEARAWLEQTFSMFDVAISQGTNLVVDFESDDAATTRSGYRMVMRIPGETPTYLEAQGWYNDRIVRTHEGWRIASRVETISYVR
jgi:3-phenylpropionate/cinnamic acid dioxygenase small subunit